MSTLLLLRHGQARFEADRYDDLTELGQRQAVETGAYFGRSAASFDEVQIGPRRRHSATATAALRDLQGASTPSTLAALDEFAEAHEILVAARQLGGLSAAEMAALSRDDQLRRYDATIAAWMQGRAHIEGRPASAVFRAGVAGWLRDVVARPARKQRLLAVTSAGVIAAAVAEILGLSIEGMSQLTRVLRNASLTEVAFSSGRVSLISFNSVTHLPPSLTSGI